ncbi:MAG: GIY-YIG nuclease family protein, partial [bacterium]|nr:GIY-YIG nuclease family protein [bacterium]
MNKSCAFGCAIWHIPTCGFTHDLGKRLEEYNSGSESSTKPYSPFELVQYEAYRNEKDAKRR